MPNNNPQGNNSFDHFGTEAAYGAVQKATRLAQAAPTSPTPALNAPRRAQRKAVRATTPYAQPPAVPQDMPTALAQVWIELAALPGASAQIKEMAARAAAQVNLGAR